MTDEELSIKAQNGDEDAVNHLLTNYKSLVNKIARSYFLTGGDMEDLVQEGMIGLFKAIKNFQDDKNTSFKTFATTCIKNQIQTAVRVASSEKNMVLSTALPIEQQDPFDEDDDEIEIVFPSPLPKPDEKIENQEMFKNTAKKIISVLSKLELKILISYLKGYNYSEIASQNQISKKSVDNALSRIKNKLLFLKNRNNNDF